MPSWTPSFISCKSCTCKPPLITSFLSVASRIHVITWRDSGEFFLLQVCSRRMLPWDAAMVVAWAYLLTFAIIAVENGPMVRISDKTPLDLYVGMYLSLPLLVLVNP